MKQKTITLDLTNEAWEALSNIILNAYFNHPNDEIITELMQEFFKDANL